MRQLKWLSLLGLLLLGPSTYAQSVRYQSQAISSRGAGIANATIAVCTQPANTNTQPCSPLATLATSTSTTSGGANPLTADSFGNFFFYAAPGRYTVQIYGPAVFGQLVTPDIVLSCDPTSTCTLANLNNVIWVCNTLYACTDVGLQAAQNALTSGGTIAIPPGSGPTISNTVNITNPNITIMGMGPASSIQVNLAGDVFNVTNSRFRLHDLEIGLPTTARTGAIVHASSSGAVIGNVYNLDVVGNATSTNNGHFFLLDSANANQWNFAQIYMPRGTTWTSAFKFSNSSGAATASGFKIQGFIGGASFTDAGIITDGAIDTLQVLQSSWNNDVGGGKAIDVRNTVAGFINPRFIYFNQVSPEAVTGTVLNVSAGRQVHYQNSYCANTTTCAAFGASSIDGDFSHNTVATIQQSVVTVAAGALRTIISYNDIQDPGQQTTNTYDAISIAANATDVTVAGNILGCAGSPFARFGANINAGTSTRIKILDNNFPNSCMGTAGISNSGTGADIIVRNNTEIQNDGPVKLFEISSPPAFANQDILWGDSTGHCLKFNANNVGASGCIPQVVASGTSTMAAGAITAATCAAAITTPATNTATTDSIEWAYATAPTLTTDALLHISPYVTSGNVNFTRCNPTAGSITGTAIVINWRVVR